MAIAKGYWSGNNWSGYQNSSLQKDSILSSALTVPSSNLAIWTGFPDGYGYVSGTISSSDNITLQFQDTTTGASSNFSTKQTSVTLNQAAFSGPGNLVLSSGNLLLNATVAANLKYVFYAGHVRQQVKAIYNALQTRGITYASNPISFPTGSQRIRYPAASLKEKSANCIDGTVLMAAAMEYIGLHPLIVVVPGHAFVGWRPLNDTIQPPDFLETTMIADSTFEAALKFGNTEYHQHALAGDGKIVDIAKARALGVTPGARLLQK
jgi:hypothetical protein